ncbi:MAG: hypothetical protein BWX52_01930 [Bacteroidetes bacterium ADurb.Bin013]|nr:MAG: hypothetical protein BWX52_01930 [Bacteroidetes bacterium ADurb.Bin013]
MNTVQCSFRACCFFTGRGIFSAAEQHLGHSLRRKLAVAFIKWLVDTLAQFFLQIQLPDLMGADLQVVGPGKGILLQEHHVVKREFKYPGSNLVDLGSQSSKIQIDPVSFQACHYSFPVICFHGKKDGSVCG